MRTIQHSFTNENSCVTSLVSFFDEVTVLVDMVRAEAIVHLNSSSACPLALDRHWTDTLSYNSPIKELDE